MPTLCPLAKWLGIAGGNCQDCPAVTRFRAVRSSAGICPGAVSMSRTPCRGCATMKSATAAKGSSMPGRAPRQLVEIIGI